VTPRIAVTAGDPRGIGPEIITKALADQKVGGRSDLVIVGPAGAGVECDVVIGEWNSADDAASAGRLAGKAIERAVQMAVNGEVQGIVTAPIDKSALYAGGYDFPGHTEMLAQLTGSRVAMMLAQMTASGGEGSNPLRVVLATTHLPLRDVPRVLTEDVIVDVADITRKSLREWFGIREPRIALCALNPHAGDGGRFGNEDVDVLAPAARRAGIDGPSCNPEDLRNRARSCAAFGLAAC